MSTYALTVGQDLGACTKRKALQGHGHTCIPKERQAYGLFNGFGFMVNIFGNNDIEEVRSFLIFNRWGETVFEAYNFEAENPAAGWDGTHRGEMLNAGVYIYVAEVLFRDGEVALYKGDVMLMR